jgi:small nuclear ribonucleoprotein (snRNP)-like protein
MMGRELRIRIVDGRVFTGRFECYDKQGNILMDNAMSTSVGDPEGTEPHVFRGMIVIQARHRVDTHLVVRDGESDPSAPDFDPYKELEERSLFEMAQAETYADGGVDPVDGHDPPVL